jgi:hypothetical protein
MKTQKAAATKHQAPKLSGASDMERSTRAVRYTHKIYVPNFRLSSIGGVAILTAKAFNQLLDPAIAIPLLLARMGKISGVRGSERNPTRKTMMGSHQL